MVLYFKKNIKKPKSLAKHRNDFHKIVFEMVTFGIQLCNITNFERFTSFFTFVHITQKVVIRTLSNYISEERL